MPKILKKKKTIGKYVLVKNVPAVVTRLKEDKGTGKLAVALTCSPYSICRWAKGVSVKEVEGHLVTRMHSDIRDRIEKLYLKERGKNPRLTIVNL